MLVMLAGYALLSPTLSLLAKLAYYAGWLCSICYLVFYAECLSVFMDAGWL
jgi:hypothetical protein